MIAGITNLETVEIGKKKAANRKGQIEVWKSSSRGDNENIRKEIEE